MCLIYTADRECPECFPVHLHALFFIFIVERASVLVHHNPVLLQRLVTASVKFFCKKSFRMSERIRRIVDDQVILFCFVSKKTKSVLIVDVHTRVI